MLTEKEKVLAIWFLGEDRTNRALYDAGIDALDSLVDPATVATDSDQYVGHIPHILPFSQILSSAVATGDHVRENAQWGIGASFMLEIPLIDSANTMVRQSWPGNVTNAARAIMIRQDSLDRLIVDTNLINTYLLNTPSDPVELEGYDKGFAYLHRLPIFELEVSAFPSVHAEPLPGENPEQLAALEFLRDLSLTLLQYYVPSVVKTGRPSPIIYRPANPGMPIVHDFSRSQ